MSLSAEVFITEKEVKGIEGSSHELSIIVAIIIGAISGLFLIPVSYLSITHTKNFCENKTTSERFSKGSRFRNGKSAKTS